MLFRVDIRPCSESILARCPGVDPDTCSCIRDTILVESEWAEQKFACTDFNTAALVNNGTYWIQSTPEKDPAVIYFEGPIEVPGGRFNASAPAGETEVEANSFLNLYECIDAACSGPGTLLQQVIFHSSCSQQLYLLDIFGSFQLIEFESTTQGVIGFGFNPSVSFSINLDAGGIGEGTVVLDFLSIVVLSEVPELLAPQIFNIPVANQGLPINVAETITLIPGQPFNVITTVGGTVGGLGCFDVSNTTIQCDATVTPTGGENGDAPDAPNSPDEEDDRRL